jgi:hypothetical protein
MGRLVHAAWIRSIRYGRSGMKVYLPIVIFEKHRLAAWKIILDRTIPILYVLNHQLDCWGGPGAARRIPPGGAGRPTGRIVARPQKANPHHL